MIKIGIDCRKISDGGIGTYIKNLLRCWKRQKVDAEFFLFSHSDDHRHFEEFRDFARILKHDYPKYSLRELFLFKKPIVDLGIGLFFSPHYTLPMNLPCPSIVTIHDLIHLRMPVEHGVLGRVYARSVIGRACKNSDIILTVSEFSKSDISELFPKFKNKIRVVYNGIDRSVYKPLPKSEVENFRKGKSLPDEFMLYVGALKRHKNPGALANAVNKLAIPLVILSNDDAIFEGKLYPEIKDKNLLKLIQLENEKEIVALYNSATLLFHPSLYEGFGLPPLEAMSCGLPVVCSNKTSLPEVVGDAAVTFSPENRDEMLKALKSVWDDRETRIILSARGLERASKFSWDDTARTSFDILRGVADQ
jgi:glycosyltransferase involved in cell wall biosynthesis